MGPTAFVAPFPIKITLNAFRTKTANVITFNAPYLGLYPQVALRNTSTFWRRNPKPH